MYRRMEVVNNGWMDNGQLDELMFGWMINAANIAKLHRQKGR